MPDESSIFDFAIRGHFEGIRGMEKLHKAIQDASQDLGVVSPRTLKRLQTQIGGVAKSFNDVLGKAGKGNLYKLTEHVRSSLDKAGQDFQKQFVAVKTAAEALEEVQKTGSDMEKEAAKRTLDAEKKKFDALERRLKKEAQAIDAMMDRRERAAEFFNRGVGEIGADLADGLAEGLGKLSSGDVRGLTDAVAGGLKTGGSVAKTSAGGAGALAKLGKAAFALSGAVMAIGAIVKILVDADSQTKDWNKSLLETAGAADFALDKASGGFRDLEGNLQAARGAALDVAMEFRQAPEDMLKTLTAANEAGFTFREMAERLSDAGDEGEAFRNMTRDSLIYAKALGVSTEEIAQMTAGWMHDFGGGQEMIRQGYAAIFQASLEAGIGSKRFFTMVQQATAGLALYNVRVEQTAALIAELSDSLGDEGAAEFVQNLQKGFTDESMQDRFKRIKTSGGAARRVISAEATRSMETFRGRSMTPEITSALAAAGVAGNDKEMLKGLADLMAKDRRSLVRRVTEYDKEAGQQLDGLIDLAKGMEGGMGAQAKAFDNLTAGGKLAMQLQQAAGVMGTPLSEMKAIQLAKFEQMTGIQGEDLEDLKRVDQQIRADYELALEMGKTDKTLEKYIVGRGDEFQEAIENTQPIMEQMTGQLVSNSESMLNLLSTTFKYMLENISRGIDLISAWTMDLSGEDRQAQGKWLQKLAERREALTSEIFNLKKEIEKAEGPEKAALQGKLTKAEELLAKTREGEANVRSAEAGYIFDYGDRDWAKLAGDTVKFNKGKRGSEAFTITSETDKFLEDQERKRQEDAKKLLDETGDVKGEIEDLPKENAKKFVQEMERKEARQLVKASGMAFDDPRKEASFIDRLTKGEINARNQVQAALEARKGLSPDLIGIAQGAGLKVNMPADDFIMRGNTVTPIHRADQLMGAKPGGPVDRGTRGGGGTVNINIHGGDQAKIYETIKRAMRESGIRPGPGQRR